MSKGLMSQKSTKKALLKASLLNPKNLLVLIVGLAAGSTFSYILIPIGIIAYGVLCYLDLSSEEFARKVLASIQLPSDPSASKENRRRSSNQQAFLNPNIEELQDLRQQILMTQDKIRHLYEGIDDFTGGLLGEFSHIENLVEKSEEFLRKAQNIQDYLASEDEEQIQRGITALQEKIQQVSDEFSKRQYQQAFDNRQKHLETLQDMQQIYERLVSQLTNISISLESMYSRMMKLKTSGYTSPRAESERVAAQLSTLLQEVELLDSALDDTLKVPKVN